MGQGRGSAVGRAVAVAAVIWLVMVSQLEAALLYNVGGAGGWTFNVQGWPNGKRFRAGDTLKFNYDSSVHNVVAVDKAGYGNCRTPAGAKVYRSGKDTINLPKGQSYFICNIAGHCESGMKIAVVAV